jgi:hypothetical protein
VLRLLLMITITLEYSGMRATRTAPDTGAAVVAAGEMFDRHGIDRTVTVGHPGALPEYWRGRTRLTGARAILRFIDDRTATT